MDVVQVVVAAAAGVTGTLGTIKLIRFVSSRREEDEESGEQEVHHKKSSLFPNGERREIIDQIQELNAERERNVRFRAETRSAMKDLTDKLMDICERLARKGI